MANNIDIAPYPARSNQSTAFVNAGIYIMRSGRIYLLAVCHPIGVKRTGPHKHNDWLSFELCVDRQPVVIDPGTFCYTGDFQTRNLFRSTFSHNTVVVDRKEQILIHKNEFSLINPHGDVNIIRWEAGENSDFLEAEHTGYNRLSKPVTHKRCFFLNKQNHQVEISDTFSGKGAHMLEWYVHLQADLNCKLKGSSVLIYRGIEPVVRLEFQGPPMTFQITEGSISRQYNQCETAEIVHLQCSQLLSEKVRLIQRFIPF